MLPLFGTIRKYPITQHNNEISVDLVDDWCVPTDQELYGGRFESENENETVLMESVTDSIEENEVITELWGSFESLNETEPEIMFSRITDNETFSLMNTETTIVNDSDLNDSSEFEFKNEDIDVDDDAVVIDFIAVLKRLEVLERKYDDMNSLITKFEESSKFGINSNSNPSTFVTHFIGIMQEMMKNGISYQRDVLGKLCDEIDEMFAIDFTNFDPFK